MRWVFYIYANITSSHTQSQLRLRQIETPDKSMFVYPHYTVFYIVRMDLCRLVFSSFEMSRYTMLGWFLSPITIFGIDTRCQVRL